VAEVVDLHRPVLLELAAVHPVIPVPMDPQVLLGQMVVLVAKILVVEVALAIQYTLGQQATAAQVLSFSNIPTIAPYPILTVD
jgi:hypothetical protein